jgi:hypothetical protein
VHWREQMLCGDCVLSGHHRSENLLHRTATRNSGYSSLLFVAKTFAASSLGDSIIVHDRGCVAVKL